MNSSPLGSRLVSAGQTLMNACAVPGRYASWLVMVLIIVVVLSVVGSALGMSELASWEQSVPLFGRHLNMISLAELQWHLFALLIMLGGAYVLAEDRHVRVDIVSSVMSKRSNALVDIIGDLIFLLPFYVFVLWFSWDYMERSFLINEQSNSGGLIDRYLVKATLPVGCALLIGAGVGRIIRSIGLLMEPTAAVPSREEAV